LFIFFDGNFKVHPIDAANTTSGIDVALVQSTRRPDHHIITLKGL